jgi:hypothetical protein
MFYYHKLFLDDYYLDIEEQEQIKQDNLAQLRVKEIDRRRNPKTKEDFNILYNELQSL